MLVVYTDKHVGHSPRSFLYRGHRVDAPETPERALRLLRAALDAGCEQIAPSDYGLAPILAVHDREYVDFLSTAHRQWLSLPQAAPELVANTFIGRHGGARPQGIVGLAGYYLSDASCSIGPESWNAAYWSAQVAVESAERLWGGDVNVYALCRPPGHHAHTDLGGGSCLLNNAAIAAQYLIGRGARKVAIVDIDVHHGNGTQQIFYRRRNVLFVSTHADPTSFYPYFSGYAAETGSGEGSGYTLNIPFPPGTLDDEFVQAVEQAAEAIRRYAPEFIVVSLGLDAAAGDPLGACSVTPKGFFAAAQCIRRLRRPTALIQEGGYLGPNLEPSLKAALGAFTGTV